MKNVGVFIILLMLCGSLANSAWAAGSAEPIRIAVLSASTNKLPRLGDFDILFIDGMWLREKMRSEDADLTNYIKDAILNGVPTVTFDGGCAIYNIVSNLPIIKEYSNQPVMVHALKVYPEKINNLMRSEELFIGEANITMGEVISKAYEWAVRRISKISYSMDSDPEVYVNSAETASSPYWSLITVHQWVYPMKPYGNLNMTRCWYALVNDGSNTYDWFNLVMETTSEPGKAVYVSDWRTADIWNWVDVDFFGDPNLLVDHGPPTTSGVSTVNY